MDLPVHTNADSSYYENAANFVSTNILVTLASSRSIPAVFHGSRKKPHVERRRFELCSGSSHLGTRSQVSGYLIMRAI